MSHDDAKMILDYAPSRAQTRQGQLEDRQPASIHGCQPPATAGWTNPAAVTIVGIARAKRQQPRARGATAGRTRLRNEAGHRGQTRRVQTREQSHRGQLSSNPGHPVRGARNIDAAQELLRKTTRTGSLPACILIKGYLLFFNDLQAKGPSDEVSLAEFVGQCSCAAQQAPSPQAWRSLAFFAFFRLHG